MKQEVTEGRGLSDAMAKQPRIFSDLYVNMVRAGESSGSLVEVLRRMARSFRAVRRSAGEVQVGADLSGDGDAAWASGIVAFFMFFMMPRFMEIFSGFGVELPLPTRMLMGISTFFINYWWLIGSVIIVAVILFKRFQATADGARKIDEWKMKAPVVGKVVKMNLFGQFARTLGTLLQNGVPVLTALKITEQVIAQPV